MSLEPGAGRVDGGVTWQWVGTTVIGILTAIMFYLVQDVKTDLKEARATIDKNSWMVSYVQGLQTSAEGRVTQIESLKNQFAYLNDRYNTMSKRILSIAQRQDRCKCPLTPESYELDVTPQRFHFGITPDTLLHRIALYELCEEVCESTDTTILKEMIEHNLHYPLP